MDAEIWKWILGAGGVLLSGGLGKFVYDLRQGRVIKEESAVTTWQGIASSRLAEIHSLKRELAWYKSEHAKLWRAYSVGPPPGAKSFPFHPPPDTPSDD